MTIATFGIAPEYYEYVANASIVGVNHRLGVIPDGSAVAANLYLTNRAGVIGAEFNGLGWVRPNLLVPTAGAMDIPNLEWDVSTILEWSLTGPAGGINVKQLFVIVGGTTTPRNTTGTLLGLLTYPSPVTIEAGQTRPVRIPWSLFAGA